MRKRIVLARVLSFAMAASVLAGCGKDAEVIEDEAVNEATEEASTEVADEAASEATQEQAEDYSGNELYEAFLDSKAKAQYKNLKFTDGDSLKEYLEDGKEYSIDEIKKYVSDNAIPTRSVDGEIVSKYIDCGKDGVEELLVKIPFDDCSSLAMILKEVDGKLKICFSGEEWDRSELHISDGGIISTAGSSGATSHGSSMAYVDTDGEYHFYYSEDVEEDPYNYIAYVGSDMVHVIFSDLDSCHIMITSYRLVDDNNKNTYYYTYDVLDANYDIITTDEDYDESSPYMQKFIEAGVTIYTHEEIKEILDKKAAEIGFNDGSSDSASYGDGKFSEVSVDHIGEDIPSVEEQTDKTALVAYNGVEGDITSYIDGYKESSLDGKLRVLRYTNGDGESCYSVGVCTIVK